MEEEVDMVEKKVTKVDTKMYKDRYREKNLGSVMIILFLEVVGEVIDVV